MAVRWGAVVRALQCTVRSNLAVRVHGWVVLVRRPGWGPLVPPFDIRLLGEGERRENTENIAPLH